MSPSAQIEVRLIESLYVEAMVLTDEIRSYFDVEARDACRQLPPEACNRLRAVSVAATQQMRQIVAWLLARLDATRAADPAREPPPELSRPTCTLAGLPSEAGEILDRIGDLEERLRMTIARYGAAPIAVSPARALIERLQGSVAR